MLKSFRLVKIVFYLVRLSKIDREQLKLIFVNYKFK